MRRSLTKSYQKRKFDPADLEDLDLKIDTETDTDSESESDTDSDSDDDEIESMFENSRVVEVTDDDFDFDQDEVVVLKKRKPSYVMVYSSTCPHCQNKKAMYSKLAKRFMGSKKKSPEVLVLAVNVKDNKTKRLQDTLDVSGVPSFYETDEEGRMAEMDDAVNVLNQSLKMKPEEVLEYRREERRPLTGPMEFPAGPEGPMAGPEGPMAGPEGPMEFPAGPETPGLELFNQGRRTIPLSGPAVGSGFENLRGQALVDALRSQQRQTPMVTGGGRSKVRKYLKGLSIKDLQTLSKEFKRPSGRNKDEIIDRLLKN